jgi:hypothetical protein
VFNDDSLSLDLNRVTDTKLRAAILQDYEYRAETKYIRAKKIMDEIREIDELGRLAAGMAYDDGAAEEDSPEEYDVRGLGQKPKTPSALKKMAGVDKDSLNMRFKAAQEKRALLSSINSADGDELEAVNIFYLTLASAEYDQADTAEIVDETSLDAYEALDALAGTLQEKLPEGEKVLNGGVRAENGREDLEWTIDEEGNVVLC